MSDPWDGMADPMSPMGELAVRLHECMAAFMRAGFDRDESFALLTQYLDGLIGGGPS